MITTRTRVLSILATVAMLVSMFACFVIPASAATTKKGAKAVWDELTWKDSTVKDEVAALYTDEGFEEMLTKMAEALSSGAAVWKAFDPTPGANPYPVFQYHEEFEAVGYDCLNWSISTVADWTAMNTVASQAPDAETGAINKYVDVETGKYFEGITFHLTGNIDFNQSTDSWMWPMGSYTGRAFCGTLNGHGFEFRDVYIYSVASGKTGYVEGYDCNNNGLFNSIGDAEIIDFGIGTGTIRMSSGNGPSFVSTFGGVVPNTKETAPTFTRVWSGATLYAASNGHASALVGANGNVGAVADMRAVEVNGFSYFGKLYKKVASGKSGHERNMVYGIYGANTASSADGGTFSNIITYPTLDLINAIISSAEQTSDAIFGFSGDLTEDIASVNNVYGIGFTKAYRNTITSDLKSAAGRSFKDDATLQWTGTAVEAAYDSNTKQGGATDPIYFTSNGTNVLPNGTAANKIVKVTVKATVEGEAQEPVTLYKNKDTALTADLLSEWAGIEANANTYIVNGNTQNTCPATLEADDTTIELVVSALGVLNDAWAPYVGMEAKYLAAGADSAWTTASNAVAAANAGEGTIDDAETAIAAFETALAENGTYATYEQEDDGKEIPGYALAGIYEAYNKAKVWAITSPEDWEAMDVVANAAAKNTAYFVDVKFHLYEDVDFDNEPMTPLGFDGGKISWFSGEIDGHGHGFSNVNISGAPGMSAIGLFRYMGDCTIRDFGINSGTITATEGHVAGSVSTFGTIYPRDEQNGRVAMAPNFTRVWSGATLKAEGDVPVSALAGTVNHFCSELHVDGFTFYGNVEITSTNTRDVVYGIFGASRVASASTSTFANVIVYPTLPAGANNTILGYVSAEAAATAKTNNISNVYGIGFNSAFRTVGSGDTAATQFSGSTYDITGDAGRVFAPDADLQYAGTPGKAAYELNGKGIGYYFTFVDGGIRPTTTAANRVVKYATIANGVEVDPIYANAGAAVDVEALLPEGAELVSVANTEGTIDAVDGKYSITGDVTVSYTISADEEEINELKAALADKIAEVEAFVADKVNLDMKYFKDSTISAEDWLAKAKSEALEDLRAAKAHLDDGDLVIAMKDDYPNFPAYKDHAKYEAYQPENANWLIVDPADWYEMNKVMNEGANAAYFANTTFHLVDDVDFGHISEWKGEVACPEVEEGAEKIPGYTLYEDYMLPLGNYGTKTFSGTIDGHGYGFENIYVSIFVSTSADQVAFGYYQDGYDNNYAGLISKIQEATFKNFGINSGVIDAKGGSNQANASTFGAIYLSGTTFKNVWSGAKVMAISNANPSGLAGLYNNQTYAIDVDGFTFYGELSKAANARTMVYGITGGNKGTIDGSTIKNVILYPTFDVNKGSVPASADGEKYASAIFGFSSPDAYAAATISNVYGIGFEKAYRATIDDLQYPNADHPELNGRVFGDDANILITGKKARELARELNAIGAETGVYYKLDANGKLRPTSEATTLVKATINFIAVGTEEIANTRTEYFNNSGTFGLRDAYSLKFMFDDEDVVVEGDGSYAGGVLTVNGDVTVTVNYTECEHKDAQGNDLYQYTHIAETKKHTRLCPTCGYTDEKNCSIEWVAGVVNTEDGTSNHTGTCTLCVSPEYTEVCNGVDTANADDCTAAHTWNFTCKVHEATYPGVEGNGTHTFTGAWTDVPETNKQTDKCANCNTVQSRINENVEITNSEFTLATKGNGEIVVKLPEGIKSAKLEIAVEGAYNFEIEGMTPVDGYYVIGTGITSVTVKVTADVTATGGKLTATLSEVVAIDDYVEIAGEKDAEIEIGFEGELYDADGNGTINLADALAALYVKAGKADAPAINLANVDTNANGAVDIDEVYAIVQKWLSDVIGTL